MQAIEISAFGAPEVLRVAVRPDPVPASGEVLIRVAASGVNRPDVLQRAGHYPAPAGASDLPGLEVAGHIVGGDAQAMVQAGFQLGDAVCVPWWLAVAMLNCAWHPWSNVCRCPRA